MLTLSSHICLTLFPPRAMSPDPCPCIPVLMEGGQGGARLPVSDWLLAILHLKSVTCGLTHWPRPSLLHSIQQ